MKEILNKLINDDQSYNKNITRYLYRTNPNLWKHILDATSFLPNDAKPKQRVWHILNDRYDRPTCPVTGQYVKWWENRYLETINRQAKGIQLSRSGKLNKKQSTEQVERRRKTILEGFQSGRLKSKKWTKEEIAARYEKIKEATLKKYGVHSTLLLDDVREKQYQSKVKKGIVTARENRSDRQIYYDEVVRLTKISWNEYFDKINPDRITRGNNWHLDHVYSIQQGFRDNIEPKIIAHWTNLRMYPGSNNSKKGIRCDKTKDQLLEDFRKDSLITDVNSRL